MIEGIFEGSRRVLCVLTLVIVICYTLDAYKYRPYLYVKYVFSDDGSIRRIGERPRALDDAWHSRDYSFTTTAGAEVNVAVYYPAAPANVLRNERNEATPEETELLNDTYRGPGKNLGVEVPRPHSVDTAFVMMNRKEFVLTEEEARVLNRDARKARAEYRRDEAGECVVFLTILWFAAACIGWIARGFLGDPRAT